MLVGCGGLPAVLALGSEERDPQRTLAAHETSCIMKSAFDLELLLQVEEREAVEDDSIHQHACACTYLHTYVSPHKYSHKGRSRIYISGRTLSYRDVQGPDFSL